MRRWRSPFVHIYHAGPRRAADGMQAREELIVAGAITALAMLAGGMLIGLAVDIFLRGG